MDEYGIIEDTRGGDTRHEGRSTLLHRPGTPLSLHRIAGRTGQPELQIYSTRHLLISKVSLVYVSAFDTVVNTYSWICGTRNRCDLSYHFFLSTLQVSKSRVTGVSPYRRTPALSILHHTQKSANEKESSHLFISTRKVSSRITYFTVYPLSQDWR